MLAWLHYHRPITGSLWGTQLLKISTWFPWFFFEIMVEANDLAFCTTEDQIQHGFKVHCCHALFLSLLKPWLQEQSGSPVESRTTDAALWHFQEIFISWIFSRTMMVGEGLRISQVFWRVISNYPTGKYLTAFYLHYFLPQLIL